MFNIGFTELIVILLVAFVFVGPKDLPKVARAIGRAVRGARKMFSEFKDETGLQETVDELKGVERDLRETARSIDPRAEFEEAKREAAKAMRDAAGHPGAASGASGASGKGASGADISSGEGASGRPSAASGAADSSASGAASASDAVNE